MNHAPAILAASFLGPEGQGNHRTGLRPWPAPLDAALAQGDLGQFHWSTLFASDPARFARMDLMSRFGLAAVELLGAGLETWPAERRDRAGVCVETGAGSLAADVSFLHTPRASLFTYTLPSTVLGEICIHYRLRGPMLCLMTGAASTPGSVQEAVQWLERGEAGACLCLRCEVADAPTTAKLPEFPRADWHAAALLLGRPDAGQWSRPLEIDSIVPLCRSVLGSAGRATHGEHRHPDRWL